MFIWLLVMYVFLAPSSGRKPETPNYRLRQQLLREYDVHVRPTLHPQNSTVVEVRILPAHLTELNENTGILTLECIIQMIWKDEFLTWKPEEYSGIKSISLPATDVWRPDITVNEGPERNKDYWDKINVFLNSSGFVVWEPSANLQLFCLIDDYSNYPQDLQTCTITLRSWTTDSGDIDLADDTDYENMTLLHEGRVQNPHWQCLQVRGQKSTFLSPETLETYVAMSYELTFKRRNVPFSFMCSLPTTAVRFLILCMFWMPDLTKKLLLGCTSLLSLITIAASVVTSLPSPVAAPFALSKISSSLVFCLTAIAVEILVHYLSSCRLDSPALLNSLASSPIGRIVNLFDKNQPTEKLDDPVDPVPKTNRWPFLAILIDRVAFLVFSVLLMAL